MRSSWSKPEDNSEKKREPDECWSVVVTISSQNVSGGGEKKLRKRKERKKERKERKKIKF